MNDDDTYGFSDAEICEGNGHIQYFREADGSGTCYCHEVKYPPRVEAYSERKGKG